MQIDPCQEFIDRFFLLFFLNNNNLAVISNLQWMIYLYLYIHFDSVCRFKKKIDGDYSNTVPKSTICTLLQQLNSLTAQIEMLK